MVTVVDVAQHAGVSTATVSRVLNGRDPVSPEARSRVLKAVRLLGYRPNSVAQSLRRGHSRTVALLAGDIEQGIYSTLTKHVQAALEDIGLDLLLFNLGHREDRLHHLLAHASSLGLRGVLIAAPHVLSIGRLRPHLATLAENGIPLISVGQRLDRHGIPSLVHDDAAGAARATRHLLDTDRAPIAFLGRIKESAVGRERYRGYRRALAERRIESVPELVWESADRYRAEAGYAATADALDRGVRPRAVLASSDELALGGMAAALDRGVRIPDDIAFVGFGGIEWSRYVRPALSTIGLDLAAVGAHVAAMFRTLDAGRPIAPLTVVEPALTTRGSG
ncbi:MAG TPA: LacI family DNA-binding transcriptional regulator [Candidatus Sulfotelmatobacter sp.]|nr:LacI family DNA-binding transcriptional regulator [Candidatus Sulfotelmatobacter sp.]